MPDERSQQPDEDERLIALRAVVADAPSGKHDAGPHLDSTLTRLARASRFRDEETAEHVERVGRTCALIARALGWGADGCINLRKASAMHDLGKVGVPDSALKKPGSLNVEERAQMERHPQIGHDILTGSGDPLMELAATIALTHHERMDGEGYPAGLAGDEISLEARITAVADVFDALTHVRVYRAAFSMEEAVEMLLDGRGTQFDSGVLDAFEEVLPEVEEVGRRYPDTATAPFEDPPGAPEDKPIRVLIVEDHEAVARGLEMVLRREGIEVAGSARTVPEARGMLERRAIDVVLLDIQLATESGLELLPATKKLGVRTLVYTGLVDTAAVERARRAGADGLAAKAGSPRELCAAIQAVAAGDSYFDERFQAGRRPARTRRLTPREHEVVILLANGLTGEEIATQLFLSPETVRTHIRNAMAHAGARTRAHLIAIAGPEGVVADESLA